MQDPVSIINQMVMREEFERALQTLENLYNPSQGTSFIATKFRVNSLGKVYLDILNKILNLEFSPKKLESLFEILCESALLSKMISCVAATEKLDTACVGIFFAANQKYTSAFLSKQILQNAKENQGLLPKHLFPIRAMFLADEILSALQTLQDLYTKFQPRNSPYINPKSPEYSPHILPHTLREYVDYFVKMYLDLLKTAATAKYEFSQEELEQLSETIQQHSLLSTPDLLTKAQGSLELIKENNPPEPFLAVEVVK